MFWRKALLALIISFFFIVPWHRPVASALPCHELAKGVRQLGAENILYHRSYFLDLTETERAHLFDQFKNVVATEAEPGMEWYLGQGLEGSYTVLQIKGSDFPRFCILSDSLSGLLNEEDILAQAFQLECQLPASAGDLRTTGLNLVELLEGELRGVQVYHGAVHLLAYVPWCAEQFILENKPVNLNLELNPLSGKGSVRLRAGIPVLLTLSHFQ